MQLDWFFTNDFISIRLLCCEKECISILSRYANEGVNKHFGNNIAE